MAFCFHVFVYMLYISLDFWNPQPSTKIQTPDTTKPSKENLDYIRPTCLVN